MDYEWCDKGHKSRDADGLYMPAGHDHEKWLERKQKYKKGSGSNTSAHATSSTAVGSNEEENKESPMMILSDKLKAALITNQGYSPDEANALIESLN